MNLDELKPGPETDRLVADALGAVETGFCWTIDDEPIGRQVLDSDGLKEWKFIPSTDLNDAFWAEGQVGLFNEYYLTFDLPNRLWLIANWDAPFCSPHYAFIAADTPAMAVCHAILKLKVSKT